MDNTAISVGIAIQSGIVLQKCNNHWCRINTSQVVNSSLVNSTSTNVVSLVETYQYHNCNSYITQAKGTTKNSNLCNVAANGLIYDNCEGNSGTWDISNSYCSDKGMRLPLRSEAIYWGGQIPSCSNYTWTSQGTDGQMSVWYNNTSINGGTSKNTFRLVRCVK